MAVDLWRRRSMILQFARRDVQERYRGSWLGLLWAFVTPLLMLLIYTFVFGVIFGLKWPEARQGTLAEFAVFTFCGIVVYNVFSETVGRAPGLIVGNPNYVKKVVFPLEILPVSALGSSLFHGAVGLLILLAANALVTGTVHATALLVPVFLLPLLFLTLAASWVLASLGVFFRDVQQLVSLGLMALFFLTPVFYSPGMIPARFRGWMALNPLAHAITGVRQCLLWGELPGWRAWTAWAVLCAAALWASHAFFMKTRRGFADVV
jgi:lipopolysaccharide transport system permease protein